MFQLEFDSLTPLTPPLPIFPGLVVLPMHQPVNMAAAQHKHNLKPLNIVVAKVPKEDAALNNQRKCTVLLRLWLLGRVMHYNSLVITWRTQIAKRAIVVTPDTL